jgi:hypothetical protein
MVHPVTEDVRDILHRLGVAYFPEPTEVAPDDGRWIGYVGKEPERPDNTITLYDTGGGQPRHNMSNTVHPTCYPTFQIRVRCVGYRESFNKLNEVAELLDQNGGFLSYGKQEDDPTVLYEYADILRTSDYLSLGFDERKRALWTVNFKAIRRQVTNE